ncbi:Trans-2,3-dihydro-3-hydroxyanthranilate isomerase [Paraconexibacter sp. AEG42_29]|uniref:Trans-2,3-dihydro-3-hydroxyanthranilate isomerase n=1 Tax=Paraconexibacter sp. AEG42_29 TaxID=2997339 RepID=A0AAU7AUP7_9ACTN
MSPQAPASRRFAQVDVFGAEPLRGNPLAVVVDSGGLDTAAMQRFANWTNLSETTFLLPPSHPDADYAVRIFTPAHELPFAGHPTLGSCHAWLQAGGRPADPDVVVQECGAGLVRVRRDPGRLAFAAPPLLRSGPVDDATLRRALTMIGADEADVVDAAWAANGPGWLAILMADAERVLALRPGAGDLDIGVVAPRPPGEAAAFEIRAFFPDHGLLLEDPVTGSLNASVAQWLIATGRATPPYTVVQGTALGRAGRVAISADADGTVWVGGATVTCVDGTVAIP